eukprot:TRINITY_DN18948_c0_g1_i1.p1 TRINITY_DN18948_c0_g1~~TRINITY_DN18948_c0_g1_i1.p1  ORF type:complete len:819 (-),score=89.28 TRINITY_DN18948_c0_g1_i1:324-2780(-)
MYETRAMPLKRLEASHTVDEGFPVEASALICSSLGSGEEVLAVVGGRKGGGFEEGVRGGASGEDFEDLCLGAVSAGPADLWTRSWDSRDASCSFRREILAFPPSSRCQFSLTPLDGAGRRLLLFGGHSGGRHGVCGGRCLNDLHVLELRGAGTQAAAAAAAVTATPRARALNAHSAHARAASASSSDGEAEDIFFADDYRAEVVARRAPPGPPRAQRPSLNVGLSSRVNGGARESNDDDGSSSSSESTSDDCCDATNGNGASVCPRTLDDVVASVGGGSKIRMRRVGRGGVAGGVSTGQTITEFAPAASRTAEKSPQPSLSSYAGQQVMMGTGSFARGSGGVSARWSQPWSERAAPLLARACHSAVLQAVSATSEEDDVGASVLIYGGLCDAGLPLGDVYEVRISHRPQLEATWTCIDAGAVGDGPVPWERQEKPVPRARHSAVLCGGGGCAQRCMVVFGGLGLSVDGAPVALGDTWTLLRPSPLKAGCCGWVRPVTRGDAPARRWGHGACVVGSSVGTDVDSVMLLCGGVSANGEHLRDCWSLDIQDMRWERVDIVSDLRSPDPRTLGYPCATEDVSQQSVDPSMPAEADFSGPCAVTWSRATQTAIIWGGRNFWTWREPNATRRRRAAAGRCAGSTASVEISRLDEKAEDLRHTNGSKCNGTRESKPLPEVFPPPRGAARQRLHRPLGVPLAGQRAGTCIQLQSSVWDVPAVPPGAPVVPPPLPTEARTPRISRQTLTRALSETAIGRGGSSPNPLASRSPPTGQRGSAPRSPLSPAASVSPMVKHVGRGERCERSGRGHQSFSASREPVAAMNLD